MRIWFATIAARIQSRDGGTRDESTSVRIAGIYVRDHGGRAIQQELIRAQHRATAETTQRKGIDKGHPDHAAKAADQAAAEADLANALLAAADTDGDGVVTKIELRKAMAALRKADKENKGNITVVDKRADAGAAPAAGNPAQGVGAAGAGGGRGNEAMARFMQLDRNHDGRLTRDEVSPQDMVMLRGADLNGDGAIEPAELQAVIARMGERMRGWPAGGNPNAGAGAAGNGAQKPPQ